MIRFGNDGWKARFDDGFTQDNVARLADGLGALWAQLSAGASVYVGYDTRRDSAEYAHDVAGVLAAHGLRVRLSQGPCPTPALAWTCARDPYSIGAVSLTASELSCDYGGVIVRNDDGGPCPREFLEEIEQAVSADSPTERGEFEASDFLEDYFSDLFAFFSPRVASGRGLKVVVDSMYGAARGSFANLLRDLGCEVVEIHMQEDPDFGGIHPAPADPWGDECERAVIENRADLGILLDCDADRAALVDEKGNLLPVRQYLPLVISSLKEAGIPGSRVVATLTSSSLLEREASRQGLAYTDVCVGFPYIYGEFSEGDVALGAEEYGGACIPSHLKERDGMYAALLVLEKLAVSDGSLSELVADQAVQIGNTIWSRRDVRIDSASAQALRNILPGLNPAELAGKKPVDVSHADGLKLTFNDGSWVLARPARTEPVVRIYAEASTSAERDKLLESAVDLVISGPIL